MKIYIPPQIKHLLPAFLVFIFLFLVGRRLIIPETFGDLGHYRAASLDDNADKELNYAGHETCSECHPEIEENKMYDLHSELNCEICHGAALAHVNDPENVNAEMISGREFCGLCHGITLGRSTDVLSLVDLEEHYTEKENCTDCHNPHQPWELKE